MPSGKSNHLSDRLVIALWNAALFGIAEGICLAILRAYPTIRAPFKTSLDALWITPTVNSVVFSAIAVGLVLAARFVPALKAPRGTVLTDALFTFIGAFAVTFSTGLIHPLAALVLAVGLTVALYRRFDLHSAAVIGVLRRCLILIPLMIVALGIGVRAYTRISERHHFLALPPARPSAPNVLVIVLDTVRADSFHRLGQPSLTPNLDEIAAQGLTYDSTWPMSSWSLPSQASILTGMYAYQHGADWPNIALNKQVHTLPEEFSSRGYVTGAFSSNSSWIVPEHVGKGFMRFDAYIPEDIVRRTVVGRGIGFFTDKIKLHPAGRGKKAPVVRREFLRFLDDYPGRPFFVYLCFMDVNRALHARWFNAYFLREAPQSEVFEGYEAGLRELDANIGRLWEQLRSRGLLENTIVVITSDHGQSFGRGVYQDHSPIGHGTSLYPEQTRVPLFVIYPPKIPAGRIIHETVSLRSAAATIMRLADIADSPFHSPSWPLPTAVSGGFHAVADQALMTLRYAPYNIESVVSNGWQYINDFSTQSKQELLFDLNTDLVAAHNLHDQSEIMATMRNLLQRLIIDGEATSTVSSPALPTTHQSGTGSGR